MLKFNKYYHVSTIEIPIGNCIVKRTDNNKWIKMFNAIKRTLVNLEDCKSVDEVNLLIKNGLEKIKFFSDSPERIFYDIVREVIAEQIREQYFPDRPNRQASIFIVDNLRDARNFKNEFRNNNSYIYECIPQNYQNLFKGDMNYISHGCNDKINLLNYRENMFLYWQANAPIKVQEILSPSPVMVVKRISL